MSKSTLNLYLVARYGNNNEGPDGLDTLFLVRAPNYRIAAKLVEKVLAGLKESKVKPYSNWVCEIGKDTGDSKNSSIIHGPFYALSAAEGYSKVWTRDYKEDGWVLISKEIKAARKSSNIIRITA